MEMESILAWRAKKGLSDLQRYLLIKLFRLTQAAETEGDEEQPWLRWRPSELGLSRKGRPYSRADSAVMSRSLARLVSRGLIEKTNNKTRNANRTTCVRLTPTGLELGSDWAARWDAHHRC